MAEKEYIEKRKLIEAWEREIEDATDLLDAFDFALEDVPAADVVEVVRCENCKHSWFNGVSLWLCQREANSYCPTVKADAFCSYGERKEQNNV